MMINIADMGHIRLELGDHGPNFKPSFARVDNVRSRGHLLDQPAALLEIDVRNEVAVVGSGRAPWIGHRE